MVQLSDVSVLGPMVTKVVDDNPQSVEDFKNGKRSCDWILGWSNHETNSW